MSKAILEKEGCLIFSPRIAEKIGLNESIVLQQVHYWLKMAEEKNLDHHFYDNQWWIYNTYSEWKKQFPFWSEHTIRRTIKNLEKQGILIPANFNYKKYDNTKWYSINYEQLENVLENRLSKMDTSICPDWTLPSVQNDTTNTREYTLDYLHQTNTKESFSPENDWEEKIRKRITVSCANHNVTDYRKDDIVNDVIYFYRYYQEQMGEPHPMLKQETFDSVVYSIISNGGMDDLSEPDTWKASVHEYFRRNIRWCDYRLPHFVSDGVQTINSFLLM